MVTDQLQDMEVQISVQHADRESLGEELFKIDGKSDNVRYHPHHGCIYICILHIYFLIALYHRTTANTLSADGKRRKPPAGRRRRRGVGW